MQQEINTQSLQALLSNANQVEAELRQFNPIMWEDALGKLPMPTLTIPSLINECQNEFTSLSNYPIQESRMSTHINTLSKIKESYNERLSVVKALTDKLDKINSSIQKSRQLLEQDLKLKVRELNKIKPSLTDDFVYHIDQINHIYQHKLDALAVPTTTNYFQLIIDSENLIRQCNDLTKEIHNAISNMRDIVMKQIDTINGLKEKWEEVCDWVPKPDIKDERLLTQRLERISNTKIRHASLLDLENLNRSAREVIDKANNEIEQARQQTIKYRKIFAEAERSLKLSRNSIDNAIKKKGIGEWGEKWTIVEIAKANLLYTEADKLWQKLPQKKFIAEAKPDCDLICKFMSDVSIETGNAVRDLQIKYERLDALESSLKLELSKQKKLNPEIKDEINTLLQKAKQETTYQNAVQDLESAKAKILKGPTVIFEHDVNVDGDFTLGDTHTHTHYH